METADKKIIYQFYDKIPKKTKYVRGICRIWPVDTYGYTTFYMDPSPNEGAGLFEIIPENNNYINKNKNKKEESDFIKAIIKELEKLKLSKNLGRKGSRKWIANDRIIKQWKTNISIKCNRYKQY